MPYDEYFDGGEYAGVDFDFDPSTLSDTASEMFGGAVESGGFDLFSPSTWDFTEIVENIEGAALTALRLNNAYQQARQPPVRASTPATIARPDGVLTTRTSTGGSVTTRMSPGQPYLTTEGTTVINNGDGTYTSTAPDGTQTRRAYPQTPGQGLGGTNSNLLLYGALGVAALYLMSRKA